MFHCVFNLECREIVFYPRGLLKLRVLGPFLVLIHNRLVLPVLVFYHAACCYDCGYLYDFSAFSDKVLLGIFNLDLAAILVLFLFFTAQMHGS